MVSMNTCKICGAPLKGRQTHFCSIECKNDYHQGYAGQRLRGVKRKLELVQMLGGKCMKCGYNKNLAALTFHHTGEKNHKLDARHLSNRSLEAIMEEFATCILLCANCHAEEHNPHLEMGKINLENY
jgi:hypothetical protein